MDSAPRAILAGLLGVAMSFLAACGGSSGLLVSDQSNTLNRQLDAVSAAVKAHNCDAATHAVSKFNNAVANLPPSVSTTLQANLNQGASTLATLAARECRTNSTTTPTISSSTTPTITSTSTPTASTPTSTTTSSTSPTTTSSRTTTSSTSPTTTSTSTPTTTATSTTSTTTSPTGPSTSSTGSGSGGAGLGGAKIGGAGTGNGQ